MKISSYVTDQKKEVEGVWRELEGGGNVLVGRYKSVTYNKALREALAPVLAGLKEGEEVDTAVFEDAVLVASSKTILLGWSDIQDDDGNELEFTEELGLYYLREARDFREEVLALSQEREAYTAAFVEKALGN